MASGQNSETDDTNTRRETSRRQKGVLVRRAIECSLQLLARLSHYRVYLTAEERSKHRTSSGDIDRHPVRGRKAQRFFLFDAPGTRNDEEHGRSSSSSSSGEDTIPKPEGFEYPDEYTMAFGIWNCFPFMRRRHKHSRVYARRSSESSDSSSGSNTIDLELHIAISCGDITNIVIGEMNPRNNSRRLEWFPPTATLNNNNDDNTNRASQRFSSMSAYETNELDSYFMEYTGRLEYAICGPAVESLEDALAAAKAGEMSMTPEVYDLALKQSLELTYERRRQFYIVKGYEEQPRRGSNSGRHHGNLSNHSKNTQSASYLASRPELRKQASKLNIEPLVPRIRNKSQMQLSSEESSPHYFKYVNRSALYRLEHSPDGNFPAQFRDVTIMFVSLGKLNCASPEGLETAQKAAVLAMQILVKYEGTMTSYGKKDIMQDSQPFDAGMLQQFAVDDKGKCQHVFVSISILRVCLQVPLYSPSLDFLLYHMKEKLCLAPRPRSSFVMRIGNCSFRILLSRCQQELSLMLCFLKATPIVVIQAYPGTLSFWQSAC